MISKIELKYEGRNEPEKENGWHLERKGIRKRNVKRVGVGVGVGVAEKNSIDAPCSRFELKTASRKLKVRWCQEPPSLLSHAGH